MELKKSRERMGSFFLKLLYFNTSLYQKAHLVQFIRFGLVGILNVFIGYMVYLVLVFWGVDYLFANIIGFSLSMVNAYYWNSKYVFVNNEPVWWIVFAKMYIAYAITGIVLGNVLLYVWIEIFSISAFWAPIINLFITFPINYIMNKFWAYRPQERRNSQRRPF